MEVKVSNKDRECPACGAGTHTLYRVDALDKSVCFECYMNDGMRVERPKRTIVKRVRR